MQWKAMPFPGYPEPPEEERRYSIGDTYACVFPDPVFAEYAQTLWDLESHDPEIRQSAVVRLQERVKVGDGEVMALLGRYCCQSGASAQWMEMGLRWYVKAAEWGDEMSYSRLLRAYRHPEDAVMEACVARLQEEGWTEEYLTGPLRQYMRRDKEDAGKEGTKL